MGLRAPRLPGQSLCMDAALPALPARPARPRLRHRAPRCRLTFISPRGCATSCAFLLRSERLPPATACVLGGPAAPCAGWTRICPARRPGQSHPVGRTLRSALRFPRGAGLPAPSPRRPSGGGQPSSPPPAPWPSGFRGLPCSLHLSVPEALWAKHLPVPPSACLQCTRVGGDLHGTLCAAVLCSRAVQLGEAT